MITVLLCVRLDTDLRRKKRLSPHPRKPTAFYSKQLTPHLAAVIILQLFFVIIIIFNYSDLILY